MSDHVEKILAVLTTTGGFTTGRVARMAEIRFGCNGHQNSGYVRQVLLSMERAGLVRKLDDDKPVCWVKVDAASIGTGLPGEKG